MDTGGTEPGFCTTEVSVLYSNGKCIKLALLEGSVMSIIEKCLLVEVSLKRGRLYNRFYGNYYL